MKGVDIMMTELFLYLINRSITAGWLILAVLVLRLLLKKAPKWIRCLLWGLVGIKLLIPISIESIFSLIPNAEVVSRELLYANTPAIDSGIEAVNQVVNPVLQGSFTPEVGASVNPLQVVAVVASWVWLLGMAVLLIYTIATYVKIKRQVREAVRLRDNIYQSERVASPFILGMAKPCIYVPYGLEKQELYCVLAHEEAHISRRDHLWKPLAFLILAVYWFQPLAWIAYVLLCRDIEFACDEKVMQQIGTDKKKQYSEALLHCSVAQGASHKMIAACPVAFGEVGVKTRIKSVLHYKKPAFWVIVTALIACVVCAVCFMTSPEETDDTTAKDIQQKSSTISLGNPTMDSSVNVYGEPDEVIAEWSEEHPEENVWGMEGELQKPPTMVLQDALSSTLNYWAVESGTYSWNYQNGNSSEMLSAEASGDVPSVAVKGKTWLQVVKYNRIDYAPYMVSFAVTPDRIVVKEYDLLDLGDSEPELLSETTYEEAFLIELRERRIYEIIAEWDEAHLEEQGFFGMAHYAFATKNTTMDEADIVTIEAQVKEVMADREGYLVITSQTDEFPGAFMLKVPTEVRDISDLQGGERISVTMRDTKLEEDHLSIYEAMHLNIP